MKKINQLPENERNLFVNLVKYYVHSDIYGDNFEGDEINLEDMSKVIQDMKDNPELEAEFNSLMKNYKDFLQGDSDSVNEAEIFDL